MTKSQTDVEWMRGLADDIAGGDEGNIEDHCGVAQRLERIAARLEEAERLLELAQVAVDEKRFPALTEERKEQLWQHYIGVCGAMRHERLDHKSDIAWQFADRDERLERAMKFLEIAKQVMDQQADRELVVGDPETDEPLPAMQWLADYGKIREQGK